MSSGNRTTRFGSGSVRADDAVTASVSVTAEEVERIMQKALLSAMTEIKELFNNKFAELNDRFDTAEARMASLENRVTDLERPSAQPQVMGDLSAELRAVKTESSESLLVSNDNEQYSRRFNIRLCGVKPSENEDCCTAALRFIKDVLRVTSVHEKDIEAAHMTARSGQSTATQQRRPTMLVRFRNTEPRDMIIRSRRILKGTHFAVTEDLTLLNTKTMNRVRNHAQVRTTWSWNGKIFAILFTGRRVTVRPFQSVDEFLAS